MVTTNIRRGTGTRRTGASLELALGSVAKPNLAVITWRWRYESGLALLLALVIIELTSAVGWGWTLVVINAAGCLIAAWPAARRQVIARAWCVITPHRVRTGCAQSWLHTRQGKIPVVLRTTAVPFGERVYLWLRAGVSARDLVAARPALTAACWAADVYVAQHERFAHLVVIDVIRRPGTRRGADGYPDAAGPPSWPHAGMLHRE